MLPWIIGGAILIYILDKSENSRARRDYDNEYKNSIDTIHSAYENAQKRDALDKLYKAEEAKKEVINNLYKDLKSQEENLKQINFELESIKELLDKKIKIEDNINPIIASRKELFSMRDNIKSKIEILNNELNIAKNELYIVKNEINGIKNEI